jgi:hypothetical protein
MRLLTATGLALLTVACLPQPSLQPLFRSEEAVIVPGLAGDWIDAKGDDAEVMRFTLKDDKSYRMTVAKENGEEDVFELRLGKVGEELYWDFTVKAKGSSDDWALPFHGFARVALVDDQLSLSFLDDEWVKRALKEGRLVVDHVETEDGLVLTAPTAELQRVIADVQGERDAFSEPSVLVRRETNQGADATKTPASE